MWGIVLATSLLGVSAAQAAPRLVPMGTYDTALGDAGAEIIDIRADGMAVLTNVGAGSPSVDILNVSNPASIQRIRRVTLANSSLGVNSVSIHPTRDYFLVVQGSASPAAVGARGTVSAYRLSDGTLLASAATGILPDAVKFSPDGLTAVIANEAEGADRNDNGGPGSLSVVNLRTFVPGVSTVLNVTQITLPSATGFPGFSTGRTDDAARLPVDNSPGTLEPEFVAFSPDSHFAYVTLQENNGVARLDLSNFTISYFGLGQTTHLADVTVDNNFNPISTLTAFREPDGIATSHLGRFFVTTDEGDTRDGSGASGVRGGRTLSIFNARTGAFVADTGAQIDNAAGALALYPDSRSDRGGSEPENLDVTFFNGKVYAAVGLERGNAVVLVDITRPRQPTVVAIAPTRINDVPGNGPEGVKFFSNDRGLFVFTANEVSGTVSAFQVIP